MLFLVFCIWRSFLRPARKKRRVVPLETYAAASAGAALELRDFFVRDMRVVKHAAHLASPYEKAPFARTAQ